MGAVVGQVARAEAAARTARAEALAAILPGCLSLHQAAARVGIDPGQVRACVRQRELLAIEHDGTWWLPEWQFKGNAPLPGLPAVLAAYPGSPMSFAAWATSPHPDLHGVTHAESLRHNRVERLLAILRADRSWSD